jgi:hypothetical protein
MTGRHVAADGGLEVVVENAGAAGHPLQLVRHQRGLQQLAQLLVPPRVQACAEEEKKEKKKKKKQTTTTKKKKKKKRGGFTRARERRRRSGEE